MNRKEELLTKYFGYDCFRKGQEELIDAVLSSRDVFGIMPTGGGKSMCYQLPALMKSGITLVISPLISLMKDQVLSLKKAGISAAYVNSTLTALQLKKVYGYMSDRRYKIIYVAPERLFTEGFLETVRSLEISFIAVDEAHCISQWGQDFRPSYLKIPQFIEMLPVRPVVAAYTATATKTVSEDIKRHLGLISPLVTVTGFDRPNLYFDVLHPEDKMKKLITLLSEREGKSGIVYCSTRKDVEKVEEVLRYRGFSVTRYHAGLENEERKNNQDDFIFDRRSIMVATNAFGMGIDKSNVSFVIHYNMPKSLEAYYQEAGRAGRDGEPADCILLFAPKDIRTAKFLIENSAENDELSEEQRSIIYKADMGRLEAMENYCKTKRCLRHEILAYFGQSSPSDCNNCGNCRETVERIDITDIAGYIFTCAYEIRRQLGYSLGITSIIKVLRGSREAKLLVDGLHTVSSYGKLSIMSNDELKKIADHLLYEGYLHKNEYEGISLTEKGVNAINSGESIEMEKRVTPVNKIIEKSKRERKAVYKAQADSELYELLRQKRLELAKAENVPAYIIFTNATLSDMAKKAPETYEDFLKVSGVGETKARLYAEEFVRVIKNHNLSG